ncbi:hypothetical protein [Paenibacillus sp. WLX2291]|uniref:hypothetical protein n=1 Tax=Paenibacillus sp. WLX2291 TaxID=3296934 RepID=UPI00398412E2
MAISIQSMREEVMQDKGDAILNISNRETLRNTLLSKIYHDTFSEKSNDIQYELEQYNSLAVEKRLAYQYLNDKHFIEIITTEESILIKITALGMERYEESDKQRRRTM